MIDFGLAKFAVSQDEDDSLDGITLGGFAGTPCFASPEQLAERDEDVRSDIYSLGVTLWYMLTGRPTFSGSLTRIIAQHLGESPRFETLSWLPSASVALLRGMLEKDVARRIRSPTELRAEIKQCIDEVHAITARKNLAEKRETLEPTSREPPSQPRAGSTPNAHWQLFENPGASNDTDFCYAMDQEPARGCEGARRGGTLPPGSLIPNAVPRTSHTAKQDRSLLPSAGPVSFPWLRISAASVTGAMLLGAGWVWNAVKYRPRDLPEVVSAASEKHNSKGVVVAISPPQPREPWTNTLGMRFLPLDDTHIAVFQTRVRDFEAFVQATHYDAEGGMSSAMKEDGLGRRILSWKSPGYRQTVEHPVVGVSWEDADQFCAWLTQQERSAGVITAFQRYRLPTDREWSRLLDFRMRTVPHLKSEADA